jgi:hypothetical protein
MKARCAVGHDTRCAAATSDTDRAASPIAPDLGTHPASGPRPRPHLGYRLGERPDLAGRLLASRWSLAPAQQDSLLAVRNVLRRGGRAFGNVNPSRPHRDGGNLAPPESWRGPVGCRPWGLPPR